MRLLIFLALLYLGYRALKIWIRRNVLNGTNAYRHTGPGDQIDEMMVKDPVCDIYFPKNSGVALHIDGKTLYFCSEECKKKYLSEKNDLGR